MAGKIKRTCEEYVYNVDSFEIVNLLYDYINYPLCHHRRCFIYLYLPLFSSSLTNVLLLPCFKIFSLILLLQSLPVNFPSIFPHTYSLLTSLPSFTFNYVSLPTCHLSFHLPPCQLSLSPFLSTFLLHSPSLYLQYVSLFLPSSATPTLFFSVCLSPFPVSLPHVLAA